VLTSLGIRNFVLIEDATLEFGPGLNALTGETGAGKTLLTRALGLLMGERAEEGFIGTAGEEALIQAVFEIAEGQVAQFPPDLCGLAGISGPGELIVTRRLGRGGKNRCYINGSSVTLGTMAAVAGALLSFAGQHEYRRLLDPAYQLAVLDQWAGADTLELAADFRQAYDKAREVDRLLRASLQAREERLREIELLQFQIAELTAARLSVEDEDALRTEQRILSYAEDIRRDLGLASELLKSEGGMADAADLVSRAAALVVGLTTVDGGLAAVADRLREILYDLLELVRELRRYIEQVESNPARLQAVEERLRLYVDLGRKYGGSTERAVTYLKAATSRLAELEQGEEDVSRLQAEAAASRTLALALATSLTEARRRAIPALEEDVAQQLSGLGMASAAMTVALDTRPTWEGLRESGADSVEFLLSANPGQPARSLAKTASGGELSRVLLGLKCALAGAGGDETLVFDEIDAGIGGRTAVAVAQKLRELGGRAQVVVVTHLPHVAAAATTHYLIEKTSEASRAVARLTRLKGEAVVDELCRMMGGRPGDAEAMAHARDLREKALGLID
jgi:DNA repair protein RecN (Recombination protein N)